MNDIRFTIKGIPRTKKNSQRIMINRANNRPFIMPSEEYKKYELEFLRQVPGNAKLSIAEPVNLMCLYFMPTERRVDLVNLLEATCDMLVKANVLQDDNSKIVASHDGSRVFKDKLNPRVEICIRPIPADTPEHGTR